MQPMRSLFVFATWSVVTVCVATATHAQVVLGVQPTHKKITATFWDLHLFNEEGLIIETWNLMDNLAIMQQIGLFK